MEPQQYWDAAAATFDEEPDHGLRDPAVHNAWVGLLSAWLPGATRSVLDVGCGTGSLASIMANLGIRVTGVDFSRQMVGRAREKTSGLSPRPTFCVMDATRLALAPRSFDALVCRHLLWALPDRGRLLSNWASLLRRGGRLLLIEGYWSTGSGIHVGELTAELPPAARIVSVEMLGDRTELWGKQVTDERYAVVVDVA